MASAFLMKIMEKPILMQRKFNSSVNAEKVVFTSNPFFAQEINATTTNKNNKLQKANGSNYFD